MSGRGIRSLLWLGAVASLVSGAVSAREQSANTRQIVRAVYPDAARQSGEQGSVDVSAMIQADGSVADVKISQSSLSKLLDEAAVSAISRWQFVPPVNARGKSEPFRFNYSFDFYKLPLLAAENALKTFTCRDFVADVDWFEATHPQQTRREVRDYQVFLIPFIAAASRARSADEMVAAGKQMRAKIATLDAAYVGCKAVPDARLQSLLEDKM